MIVNLYKLIEKKFKQNIEDETTLNLALDVLNQRENLEQENKKYKEVIDRAIEYLENKRVREKAVIDIDVLEGILKEVEHE